ncbi:MAG: RluA family pseudouridine synthase [Bacteroidota bacterium]
MNVETSDENSDLYEHQQIEVDQNQSLIRIDKFLMDRLQNATRTKIQNGIKQGFVKVNDALVKSNYKVHPGDLVSIYLPEPPRDEELTPENIALDIVFEDADILVVNKAAGMVVHPAYQNWTGTLVNALAYHFEKLPEMKGNVGRPGLVHRIDKDTSGLLVIAKTEVAMQGLAKQFFDHSIERTYYALVWGILNEEKGTIDVHVGRSLKDRRITAVFPEADFGKRAITHFEVVESLRYVSLVKCRLETGRTHQIRAHMRHHGHPLFNDATYGGSEILQGNPFTKYKQFVNNCFKILPRQALHAKTLGFLHPTTHESVHFNSELPPDFDEVLQKWRQYVTFVD